VDQDNPTVRGKVHYIGPTERFGKNDFRVRNVVLIQNEDAKWPNYIPIKFTEDDCETASDLSIGDEIEVEYYLRGRKWQKDRDSEIKYFCDIQFVDYQRVGNSQPTRPPDQVPDSDIPF
jgi:hypothetical protein